MSVWREVGNRVFVRRYPFLDSNVGAVVGDDGVLIVDTRSSHRQADEIRRELAEVTSLPIVRVVNTHMHSDHCFGNARFRPAELWGHERCAAAIRADGERARASLMAGYPDLADEFQEVEIVPPDHTFTDRVSLSWGGRSVELRYLGRGHTDNDIVVVVPRAHGQVPEVVFVGDLLENGAPPWFGDGFPLDWPSTCDAIIALMGEVVVPGHGAVGDRAFATTQAADIGAISHLIRQVHRRQLSAQEAIAGGPFPPGTMQEALERGLAQLRGDLR